MIREYILPRLTDYSEKDVLKAFTELTKSKQLKGRRTWPDIYYDEYLALTRHPVTHEEYSSQFIDPPRGGYENYVEKSLPLIV